MAERAQRRDRATAYQTAWLSDKVLLAAGELPLPSAAGDGVRIKLMPSSDAEAHWLPLDRSPSNASTSRGLLLVVLPRRIRSREFTVISPSRFPLVRPDGAGALTTDVRTLLTEHLGILDPETRAEAQSFVLAKCSRAQRMDRKLAAGLHQLREALRNRLPTSPVERDRDLVLQVDALYGIDSRAFYVEGWSRGEHEIRDLTIIAPEGWAVQLNGRVYRYPRPDVAEFFGESGSELMNRYGFVAYFELPAASVLSTGWVLQALDSSGEGVEALVPTLTTDERLIRNSIVGDVELESLPEDRLRREHLLPALLRMQRLIAEQTHIRLVEQFGEPPANPTVSIVVPLFKRVDFVEHQLAQFVLDPELLHADLIYVLDSPEDAPYLRALALQLYRLYRVPFRLATLTRNGGFTLANNLGASLARAPHLLLLNSDVLPERPGWLSDLVAFYESTPRIGALSPKLLYEDETLQFAGLYFDRPEGAHLWSNEHLYKGLHRDLPEANVVRPVPAVTGACLLISTELFRELGGLRGGYVQGDYEDSDLCLRLAEAGYENWYYPEVALYHLEGQSYPSELRKATSEFNKWLHTYLWGDRLPAHVLTEHSTSWPS